MKLSKSLTLIPVTVFSASSFAAVAVPGSIHCDQMYLDESGNALLNASLEFKYSATPTGERRASYDTMDLQSGISETVLKSDLDCTAWGDWAGGTGAFNCTAGGLSGTDGFGMYFSHEGPVTSRYSELVTVLFSDCTIR